MSAFRQLSHKEKAAFQANSDAYRKYILEDQKTIEILDQVLGKYPALDTREKRAAWRAGYELNGPSVIYTSKNSNTSLSWKAIDPEGIDHDVSEFWRSDDRKNATDNDAYYYTLGACMSCQRIKPGVSPCIPD